MFAENAVPKNQQNLVIAKLIISGKHLYHLVNYHDFVYKMVGVPENTVLASTKLTEKNSLDGFRGPVTQPSVKWGDFNLEAWTFKTYLANFTTSTN